MKKLFCVFLAFICFSCSSVKIFNENVYGKWLLTKAIIGEKIVYDETKTEVLITLNISKNEDGSLLFSGKMPVNHYSGNVSCVDGVFSKFDMASTKMAGSKKDMVLENKYVQVLCSGGVIDYLTKNGKKMLFITNEKSSTFLEFRFN